MIHEEKTYSSLLARAHEMQCFVALVHHSTNAQKQEIDQTEKITRFLRELNNFHFFLLSFGKKKYYKGMYFCVREWCVSVYGEQGIVYSLMLQIRR